jgi:sugar fermentation stimulation protein A
LDLKCDELAVVLERPNRFLGIVDIIDSRTGKVKSKSVKAHVHDPGRLKEILYPGNNVLLKKPDKKKLKDRKTKWDVIAGWVGEQWVLIHSGYHRILVERILNEKICPLGQLSNIKPEVKFGDSRLDFLVTHPDGHETYLEVKGCTLTKDGRALFPDAPTERGTRHLRSLMLAKERRYGAGIIILVFRADSECFAPNSETDPKFTETFKAARAAGVEVYPMVLKYQDSVITFERMVPVCPDRK